MSPQTLIGASSSSSTGCELKTSLAASTTERTSFSVNCTALPGLRNERARPVRAARRRVSQPASQPHSDSDSDRPLAAGFQEFGDDVVNVERLGQRLPSAARGALSGATRARERARARARRRRRHRKKNRCAANAPVGRVYLDPGDALVDTSDLKAGGTVTVDVTCTASMAGVALLGVPGTRVFHARAVEVVDRYRSDP